VKAFLRCFFPIGIPLLSDSEFHFPKSARRKEKERERERERKGGRERKFRRVECRDSILKNLRHSRRRPVEVYRGFSVSRPKEKLVKSFRPYEKRFLYVGSKLHGEIIVYFSFYLIVETVIFASAEYSIKFIKRRKCIPEISFLRKRSSLSRLPVFP